MPFLGRGRRPFPDHRRVHTARDPRLRQPIPALSNPQQNANQVLNATAVTLNRAGNSARNPVLAGLGFGIQLPLGQDDDVKGLYHFQKQSQLGANLRDQATVLAPGVFGFDFLIGSGQSAAGSPSTGAVRNFIRVGGIFGSFEREYWAKSKDHDIVVCNGEAALDEETLLPVEIVAEIIDPTREWHEVKVDFFLSWNDEFQVQHRRNAEDEESGFLKAYGGAAWVSFFDTDPGTEGVGVQVNPLNQVSVSGRRTIQVENSEGLKEITARFRSKKDSAYFVDVPILIRLVDEVVTCSAPIAEPCTDLYLKMGTTTPAGLPSRASVPGEQVVAGPDASIYQDLLLVQVRAAYVGTPTLVIRRLAWVASSPAVSGARLAQVGDDEEYLPLVQVSSSPAEDPPYNPPKRLTAALSVSQLTADNVALIVVMVKDDPLHSLPVVYAGPAARNLQFFPSGGLGGGPVCAY